VRSAGGIARVVGIVAGVVGSLITPSLAKAGPDLSGLVPEWAITVGLAMLIVLIGGPWAASLWILGRGASLTARCFAALYAIGSAMLLFAIVREPAWPMIATLPTLLLLVGRRRFEGLFRKTGNLCRALWRML
jgi:hypothetical protein